MRSLITVAGAFAENAIASSARLDAVSPPNPTR
jgi:hypothetical protein